MNSPFILVTGDNWAKLVAAKEGSLPDSGCCWQGLSLRLPRIWWLSLFSTSYALRDAMQPRVVTRTAQQVATAAGTPSSRRDGRDYRFLREGWRPSPVKKVPQDARVRLPAVPLLRTCAAQPPLPHRPSKVPLAELSMRRRKGPELRVTKTGQKIRLLAAGLHLNLGGCTIGGGHRSGGVGGGVGAGMTWLALNGLHERKQKLE